MASDDRREDVRIQKRLEVEYVSDQQRFVAQLSDLSEGGAFIDTSNPLPVGTRLGYRFSLPGEGGTLAGDAVVVWVQPTVGMAVEFRDLSAEDHDRLRFFVADEFFGKGTGG